MFDLGYAKRSILLAGLGLSLQAATIFNSFRPDGSYYNYIGWGAVAPAQLAYAFTVPSSNYLFKSAALALSKGIGPDNVVDIFLASDASGMPGAVIESFRNRSAPLY